MVDVGRPRCLGDGDLAGVAEVRGAVGVVGGRTHAQHPVLGVQDDAALLGSASIDPSLPPEVDHGHTPFAPRPRIKLVAIMRLPSSQVGRVGLEPTTDGL